MMTVEAEGRYSPGAEQRFVALSKRHRRRSGSFAAVLRGSRFCLHSVSMVNVLVRDLPDDVHHALQQRAARRGQSLQHYLATELKRLAETPSLEEVLDRIERRRGGSVGLRQATEDLAADRRAR